MYLSDVVVAIKLSYLGLAGVKVDIFIGVVKRKLNLSCVQKLICRFGYWCFGVNTIYLHGG